jgi:hypothetical protein
LKTEGRITRNTWERGRNTDVSPSKIDPNQYLEAHNVELVGDGEFFSLVNQAGTTNVLDLGIPATAQVLQMSNHIYSCTVR